MKSQAVEYYDWMEDVGPVLLTNLNEILVAKGVEPVRELHGGTFKDGKWVGVMESQDYRNYWHAYIECWGDKLHNDSYQSVYFPHPDDDEHWQFYINDLRKWANSHYDPVDPNWTDDLVTALRKTIKDHFPLDPDGDSSNIVFWWCW